MNSPRAIRNRRRRPLRTRPSLNFSTLSRPVYPGYLSLPFVPFSRHFTGRAQQHTPWRGETLFYFYYFSSSISLSPTNVAPSRLPYDGNRRILIKMSIEAYRSSDTRITTSEILLFYIYIPTRNIQVTFNRPPPPDRRRLRFSRRNKLNIYLLEECTRVTHVALSSDIFIFIIIFNFTFWPKPRTFF